MKVYNIGILLTRQCNQHCYYCDVYKPYNNEQIEVDLDYLQYVISLYGNIPLHIEISGGEPGLVNNFEEIVTKLL
ncbi:MAG TPA: radical SAM protein, partial [Bacilli bacterium]|nr:radical SAM protein [Bacilli bacterium]